ncbi:MAG: FAD-dependent thymidylate synthase [Candidatus Pacebacteria bacterium]|nr:FAD-dependent thymidylate synthase [Candidatus Paceibacterota bacterium]
MGLHIEKRREIVSGLIAYHAGVHRTRNGTPYLQEPGVVLIAQPVVNLEGMRPFLLGFGEELDFAQYLDDPVKLSAGDQLIKAAGQACYASYGPRRSMNDQAQKYLDHIKESGHGSVMEHVNITLFLYGISRSLTHELVRHRAGFAFSQLSQRYVSGKVLRFVERPEYDGNPKLHDRFEQRIDQYAEEYNVVAEVLMDIQQAGSEILSGEAKTDLRKKVQQTARSVLPNETETHMFITGNVRSWRHVMEMRAEKTAEVEIRRLGVKICYIMKAVCPLIFSDYTIEKIADGTEVVQTKYRKV